MVVRAYQTKKVVPGDTLFTILDASLPALGDTDIVVITSKIVSICQGRVVPRDANIGKDNLIKKEADTILSGSGASGKYHVYLTIKNHTIIANSGIDESNGGGYFILWPADPFAQAARIWKYLKTKHTLSHLGVLITDSHIVPLRWGTRGFALSWCGFLPLRNYIGTPDIFGRNLRMTKAHVADGLAAAAVVVMGEGSEQTPLALIQEAPVQFTQRPPTKKEIADLTISLSDDLYSPILTSAAWDTNANNET